MAGRVRSGQCGHRRIHRLLSGGGRWGIPGAGGTRPPLLRNRRLPRKQNRYRAGVPGLRPAAPAPAPRPDGTGRKTRGSSWWLHARRPRGRSRTHLSPRRTAPHRSARIRSGDAVGRDGRGSAHCRAGRGGPAGVPQCFPDVPTSPLRMPGAHWGNCCGGPGAAPLPAASGHPAAPPQPPFPPRCPRLRNRGGPVRAAPALPGPRPEGLPPAFPRHGPPRRAASSQRTDPGAERLPDPRSHRDPHRGRRVVSSGSGMGSVTSLSTALRFPTAELHGSVPVPAGLRGARKALRHR